MAISRPIIDDQELRQTMFNMVRNLTNTNLAIAYQQRVYYEYPWEVIDIVQNDYPDAIKLGDKMKAQQLKLCIESLREWYIAIIQLNNTVYIPDEDEHNWYSDHV